MQNLDPHWNHVETENCLFFTPCKLLPIACKVHSGSIKNEVNLHHFFGSKLRNTGTVRSKYKRKKTRHLRLLPWRPAAGQLSSPASPGSLPSPTMGLIIVIWFKTLTTGQQGCGSGPGSQLDPDSIGSVDPDPYSESGSGSSREKMAHKSRKNLRNSMF